MAKPVSGRVWVCLIVLSAVSALNNVDRGLFALLLPSIQKSIPLSDTMVGVLLGPAFMIVYSIAGLPIAWLADRWNRRNIIAFGLLFWSLITALTGAAARPLHFLLLRAALGLGEATNVAPTMSLAGDLVNARIRPFAISVITVGTPLGILLFFPLVGTISSAYDWRTAFLVMGVIGVLIAGMTLLLVPEPRETLARDRTETERTAPGKPDFGQLIVECRRALANHAFRTLILAGCCFSFMYGAMASWAPSFLVRAHGLTVGEVGATLGMFRGGAGVLAALAGGGIAAWMGRHDQRWVCWIPAILCALIVPAELMLLFGQKRMVWQTGLALESLFLSAAIPSTFALMVQLADVRARTQWAACYLLIFNLVGQSLGPFLVGFLSQRFTALGEDHALRNALLIVPVSTAAASWLFWRLGDAVRAAAQTAPASAANPAS
jgi:MFS family permease